MSKFPLIGLAVALILAGCASTPAPAPSPVVDTDAIDRIFSNVPVIDDAAPPRRYSPAQGAALERRSGYRVDRSVSSSGQNQRIRFLVLHYTGGDDTAAFRALTGGNVSAHYLVTAAPGEYQNQPVVMQLVNEDKRAWHAGVSAWGDRVNLNDTSIGIEIVNRGHYNSPDGLVWDPYSRAQIELVTALTRDIVNRYNIAPENVLGHSDIAPGRKVDPGPFFPWQRLHEAGVGAWPERHVVTRYQRELSTAPLSMAQLQRALGVWGYPVAVTGTHDEPTRKALGAFQMHFRPADTRGNVDVESQAILLALIERYHGLADVRTVRQ
ncbi:N-acetylmuramoyl-L-alanine amidase [Kushneria indalinina]|uniref:N-acetylmuramoyl-L-alanine amidase n=1 Tax=Kushneria indalinina DSM 14324 TaxID=1122140 RepID=A0A3D9DWE9_9GAMM|nr:N-acetylmuramoyl-L-alanine amidase [Kushneria indalinina]REC95076.1 N-acetyl-anhydromuramyl-L-alanine amidase AmpD [Kushneria indalinina DSM 14324]